MAETALVPRTPEEEARLLEVQRLKTQRKELRMSARAAELKERVDLVMLTAARQVHLKRYVFLPDDELRAKHKLTPQQIAVVRQWENPKKSTAFAIESSAKLIEAKTRAEGDRPSVKINVENATIVLPEKKDETMTPVVIEVVSDDK